jgi:hypothetical protein
MVDSDIDMLRNFIGIFDEGALRRDVLAMLCHVFGSGKDLSRQNGRQCIVRAANKDSSESEIFIEILVKNEQTERVLAKYALLLERISR